MRTLLDDIDGFDAPDLDWYIDPKDKDPRDELTRQIAFLRVLHMAAPAVTAWAVPNAARRSQWEATKAKREGMKAGVLDLTCVWNRGVAFIEFKDGQKMPSDSQRDMLNNLRRMGQHCGVFRQEASAIAFLRSIGAPFQMGEREADLVLKLRK